jgi:mRNA interferase HigB
MHVISRKALVDFWKLHPPARGPMLAWFKVIEKSACANFAGVRAIFNSTDKVGGYTVFNVGGQGYRVITAIHYNRQKIYIRHVLTHAEYDRWTIKVRSEK